LALHNPHSHVHVHVHGHGHVYVYVHVHVHVYNHVYDHVYVLLLIQVDYLIPVETSESSNSRPKGFSVARGQGDPWSMV
jgi:hypothetical protein